MNVKRCARCGENHEGLEMKPLTMPTWDGEWTHWTTCPANGEPIMVSVVRDDGEELVEPTWFNPPDHRLKIIKLPPSGFLRSLVDGNLLPEFVKKSFGLPGDVQICRVSHHFSFMTVEIALMLWSSEFPEVEECCIIPEVFRA
jgi:hypothetical protein